VHAGGYATRPDSSARPDHQGRLHILQVIKCLGYGGAERLLVDMVASGDKQAFDYEVAYVLSAENALAPAIAAGGTLVHSLGGRGNWDLRWMSRLRARIINGRFDVVHFHLPYTAALGRLVVASIPKAKQRPAIVYTEHSQWNKMALLIRGLNRASIGLDQSLIVVSEAARDALPRALQEHARVIVHGIDLSRSERLLTQRADVRNEVRSELGIREGEVVVLTVANLRPEKGYDVLLDAARLIEDRDLPVRFVAVGRGPLEEELKERHRQLGLGERFQFLGPRQDVLNLMIGSDIFVLASRQEGLPVVLMEATSVGMPIVATAVGAVPLVLRDDVDGLIVPPERADDLADALEHVISDPEMRQRLAQGAKTRSPMFDLASASREIEDIYRALAEADR
jgi:glycosyltransferase involved in cell wall biosynthesis